jgi:hypothetical protein
MWIELPPNNIRLNILCSQEAIEVNYAQNQGPFLGVYHPSWRILLGLSCKQNQPQQQLQRIITIKDQGSRAIISTYHQTI